VGRQTDIAAEQALALGGAGHVATDNAQGSPLLRGAFVASLCFSVGRRLATVRAARYLAMGALRSPHSTHGQSAKWQDSADLVTLRAFAGVHAKESATIRVTLCPRLTPALLHPIKERR